MKSRSLPRTIVMVVLIAAAILSVLQGFSNAVYRAGGSQDTQWGPSRLLLEHVNPFAAFQNSTSISRQYIILSQLPDYPASGLIFLWPIAIWDWDTARTLWAVLNIIFTGIVLFCLFRLLPSDAPVLSKVMIAAFFVAGTPWRNAVGNGQHSLFSLSFLLLALMLMHRHTVAAGFSLAASWFKYTIAFPMSLIFLRSWRGLAVIAIAGGIHIVLTLFAAVWTSSNVWDLLLGSVSVALAETGEGYMDVFSLASKLGLSSPFFPGLASATILIVTYLAVRRDDDLLSALSTLSFAAMVCLFHISYDMVILVIPLAYALGRRLINLRGAYYLVCILLIWYVERIVWGPNPGDMRAAAGLYYWLEVVIFYGVLILDWINAFSQRRFEGRGYAWRAVLPREA